MFRIKIAGVLLVALAALSFDAQPARAGWHHWGCYGGWYSYPYVAVYRPVVYTPVYYRSWSCYRPYAWWHGCRFGCGACSCGTLSYYTPAYPQCGTWGYSTSGCYQVAPDCCGGVIVESYKSVAPSAEPAPADAADAPPELPLPPEPETRSVVPPPPAPAEPAVETPRTTPAPPEPAPAEPALPAPTPAEPAPALPGLPEPPPADPAGQLPTLPPDADPLLPPGPQPDAAMPPEPAPALPLLPGGNGARRQPADSAVLAVQVPADARVYVNGMLTKTPGTYRQYLSRGLSRGHDYTYEVRVEVTRNGRTYDSTRTVNLWAGGSAQLAFRMDQATPRVASPSAAAATSLTLRVPEAARVTLEGRPTEATGALRTFTTHELQDGQRWQGYRVVVELEQGGRVEKSEKTVDLIGGQNHELSFDFQPERVALR